MTGTLIWKQVPFDRFCGFQEQETGSKFSYQDIFLTSQKKPKKPGTFKVGECCEESSLVGIISAATIFMKTALVLLFSREFIVILPIPIREVY